MDPSSPNNLTPDAGAESLLPADALAVDRVLDPRNGSLADAAGEASPPRQAQVRRLLAMLALDPAPAPPHDLTARTLAAVRRATPREQPLPRLLLTERPGPRFSGMPLRLPEMLAVAAMIVFGICIALPALVRNRSEARRFACESNLAAAGASFGLYASDFNDLLPRQHLQPGSPWYHVGEQPRNGQAVQSNSANLYLLARQHYVSPGALACPENREAPREMSPSMYDWPRYEAVSYSYQNQYTPVSQRLSAQESPLLADKNPLFLRSTAGSLRFRTELQRDTNSFAHNGAGQNLLVSDGSVHWSTRPVYRGNHLWLIEGVDRYNGTEAPSEAGDIFLVP